MKIDKVFVDSVRVGERHRTLDRERVATLAESMKVLGLQQPISVWADDEDQVYLVAGLHRLEAARSLGWEDIDASIIDLSPIQREMWEISENLHRVGLTKDERDAHIRRYAELLEQAGNQVRQNVGPEIGYKKPPPQIKGAAQKIAEETGLNVRTIQRAINPPPRAPSKQSVDDHGDPNMAEVAERLARKYTVGQLQEIINHLADVIKERLGHAG